MGRSGISGYTGAASFDSGLAACDAGDRHLYCFEQ
jgi:hypothetical protein